MIILPILQIIGVPSSAKLAADSSCHPKTPPKNSVGMAYPLVNVNKKLWKIIMFNGKIHYFVWAMFNSFLYVYQRVSRFF